MSREVLIKRLVQANTVNANGYLYDEETLNKSLKTFMDNDGSIRVDNYTVDEINKMIESKTMTNGKFDIVGQLLEVTDTHLKIRLMTDISDEDLELYSSNIHVTASDLENTNADTEEAIWLAKIDRVDRIIIGKY